jgi:hypothetical protein
MTVIYADLTGGYAGELFVERPEASGKLWMSDPAFFHFLIV